MKTRVIYTKNARRDLKSLNKKDAVQIVRKIELYSRRGNPLKYAKKLKHPFDDLYRFRIGKYRAIFEIDSKGDILFLIILTVGYRKNIYKN